VVSLAAALAGLAGALAAAGLGSLAIGGKRKRSVASGRLLRALARAGGSFHLEPPRDLDTRIAAAGRPAGLGPRELMAAKLGASALGAAEGLVLAGAASPRLALVLLIAGPVAGFLAPDLWLARRSAERARRIRHELPALLDLLRVTVESGSSLAEALRSVGARTHGPLAQEWRAAGREVALGVPLERALHGMATRAPLAEVQTLVAALDRARRHGVPLADTLSAQARDARFALARHAREEAARAGPKIQLVVALLLVPSVLLLVAPALLAALLGPGGPSAGGLLPLAAL
jgi:tight adherence protein C